MRISTLIKQHSLLKSIYNFYHFHYQHWHISILRNSYYVKFAPKFFLALYYRILAMIENERGSLSPRLRDHACCIIATAVQRDLETEQGRRIGHLLFSMLFPYSRRLSVSARRRIDAKYSANDRAPSRILVE